MKSLTNEEIKKKTLREQQRYKKYKMKELEIAVQLHKKIEV